jgi:lambda family phage portal protein
MNKQSSPLNIPRPGTGTAPVPVPVSTPQRTSGRRVRYSPRALDNFFYGGSGAYEGATSDRAFRNWSYSNGVADAEILGDLNTLRERSRDLYRNNAIGRGIMNTMTINIVGAGLKLQAAPDRIFLNMDEDYADTWEDNVERKFENWASSKDADAARSSTFYDLQNLAFLSYCMSGEVFSLLPILVRREIMQLCVQLIEADLVQNGPGQFTSKNMRDGVEVDDYGAPKAYNIRTDMTEWKRVLAYGEKTGRPNVIHLFRQERPGQSRGVPLLASIMESIKQVDRGTKAVTASMVVQSMFTAFIKSQNAHVLDSGIPGATQQPNIDSTLDDSEYDYTMAPAAVVRLKPDEDITFADPTQPKSEFEAFIMTHLMLAGMAVGVPYEILSKRFLASYSASRASRIEAWRYFLMEREKFNRDFNQVIYEEWLAVEVLAGRIPAPGFFASEDVRKAYCGAEWLGSSMGQIDEMKEIGAAALAIKEKLSTRSKETAKLFGGDFAKNIKRLKREEAMIGPEAQAPVVPMVDDKKSDSVDEEEEE